MGGQKVVGRLSNSRSPRSSSSSRRGSGSFTRATTSLQLEDELDQLSMGFDLEHFSGAQGENGRYNKPNDTENFNGQSNSTRAQRRRPSIGSESGRAVLRRLNGKMKPGVVSTSSSSSTGETGTSVSLLTRATAVFFRLVHTTSLYRRSPVSLVLQDLSEEAQDPPTMQPTRTGKMIDIWTIFTMLSIIWSPSGKPIDQGEIKILLRGLRSRTSGARTLCVVLCLQFSACHKVSKLYNQRNKESAGPGCQILCSCGALT